MSQLDELTAEIKKKDNEHYRFTSANTTKVSSRKARGFENVSPQDPAVKGTTLEKLAQSDGTIRFGGLILQKTSKENKERLQKQIEDRTKRRMDSIKRSYEENGENIKRQLGKKHAGFKVIHEEKGD
jgi:ATP-dependent Lon protease